MISNDVVLSEIAKKIGTKRKIVSKKIEDKELGTVYVSRFTGKPIKDAKGHFLPGNRANPNGPPRKPEIAILREALLRAKERRGFDFLDYFVERSFDSDDIAIALAKKLIPDKSTQDIELQEYLHEDIKDLSIDELFRRRDSVIKRIVEVRQRDKLSNQDKPVVSIPASSSPKAV